MNGVGPIRFDEPLDVEEIPEFHVARLILLVQICGAGANPVIEGRLKLAKLDFFIRYPSFLELGLKRLQVETGSPNLLTYHAGVEGVEASMIRYRYGPWDPRYYDFLAMMQGRGLIKIGSSKAGVETFRLTKEGKRLAKELQESDAFAPIVQRCQVVSQTFAEKNGTFLKEFIYQHFPEEVTSLSSGRIIASDPTALERDR